MKQNVRFNEGICHEQIQPDQIQNGRLSAIIKHPPLWWMLTVFALTGRRRRVLFRQ